MNNLSLGDKVEHIESGRKMIFEAHIAHMGAPGVKCKDIETGELIKEIFDLKKIKKIE